MTNLQRRVKIVQWFSIFSRELHSARARAAVEDMASKSGGACDRSMNGNHFRSTISLQNHPRCGRVVMMTCNFVR